MCSVLSDAVAVLLETVPGRGGEASRGRLSPKREIPIPVRGTAPFQHQPVAARTCCGDCLRRPPQDLEQRRTSVPMFE